MPDLSLGTVSTGIGLAKTGFDVLSFVRGLSEENTISAFFSWDGTRLHGDDRLTVERHHIEDDESVWFYSVDGPAEFEFRRFPAVDSVVELLGTKVGEMSPDARFWRWVGNTLPGRIYGGTAASVKVDFVVVGFKPKALVDHFGGGS